MPLESCTNEEAYRLLIEESRAHPVVLFKHSTRCPISAAARQEMEKFADESPAATCRQVLVIEQRPLSLLIAEETGVPHQSPQVLLLRDGKVVWHASHYNITSRRVTEAFAQTWE